MWDIYCYGNILVLFPVLRIGTFRVKKNLLFRIFNIERNFLFLDEWPRNRCSQWYLVPLLSFWSFLIAWGWIVSINAFPFRVAVPLCWHEELWFPINYVPFFVRERLFLSNIVPALKYRFLFIHLRNNCSHWRFRFERNVPFYWHMEQFVPNH